MDRNGRYINKARGTMDHEGPVDFVKRTGK
jgi:hypothetical protein